VVNDAWVPPPAADAYLRHLRLGADRAEGTTRVYAGGLALFLGWCATGGRDLLSGACHALASGGVDSSVLGLLYEVSDDRYLPAKLKT